MIRLVIFVALLATSHCALSKDGVSGQPLQSKELTDIKKRYEQCVFAKGREILKVSNLRDAIEYAPVACRRDLMQTKKYLLDSAFKVEVIDQLVSSIEEGVKIDLVNLLIKDLNK